MDNNQIRIRVQFPATMRLEGHKSGSEVEVPAGTSIEELLTSFGVKKEHQKYIFAMVNGEKRSLSHTLQNHEELRLVLPVGGG